jgi:hypothetical protein
MSQQQTILALQTIVADQSCSDDMRMVHAPQKIAFWLAPLRPLGLCPAPVLLLAACLPPSWHSPQVPPYPWPQSHAGRGPHPACWQQHAQGC